MCNRNHKRRLPSSWIILILLLVCGPFLGHSPTSSQIIQHSLSALTAAELVRLDAFATLQEMPVLVSQGLSPNPLGRLATSPDHRKQDAQPFHLSPTPEPAYTQSVRFVSFHPAFELAPDVWSGFACASRSPPFLG